MDGSKAVVGAEKPISKKDIFKTVEQRYEKVKAEKARMIKEWKDNLKDLTTNAKTKMKYYDAEIVTLDRNIKK